MFSTEKKSRQLFFSLFLTSTFKNANINTSVYATLPATLHWACTKMYTFWLMKITYKTISPTYTQNILSLILRRGNNDFVLGVVPFDVQLS